MNTNGIKTGDIVQCDVRGDLFYALVETPMVHRSNRKGIQLAALTRRPLPTHFVTARQVKGHWRKSKQSRA